MWFVCLYRPTIPGVRSPGCQLYLLFHESGGGPTGKDQGEWMWHRQDFSQGLLTMSPLLLQLPSLCHPHTQPQGTGALAATWALPATWALASWLGLSLSLSFPSASPEQTRPGPTEITWHRGLEIQPLPGNLADPRSLEGARFKTSAPGP